MERRDTGPDRILLATAVALIFVGVLLVFDASYARAGQSALTNHDSFYYLKRQAQWAVGALIALYIGMRIPYPFWRRFAGHGIAVSIVLLLAVLVIGSERNGSRRWLGMGSFSFQPSELAKIALVIFLAAYSDIWRERIRDLKRGFLPAVAVLTILGALIAKEDLGTAISLGLTGLILIAVAGARARHVGGLIAGALVAGIGLVLIEPYRLDRIRAWMDPWRHYDGPGYQPVHGLLALGSGGLTGHGIGRGTQKFLYLPAEHTDYIFATIGEELGLIGGIVLLGVFALLLVRGLTIAHRCPDRFGALLAAGLTIMMVVQAWLNIAVVTMTIPATGVPLPFISYGGSSLLLTAFAAGIVLNVSSGSASGLRKAAT